MHDWNHDGKIDRKDRMRDYYIYNELSKKESNTGRTGSVKRNTVRQNSSGGSSEGNIGGVVVMIVIIIVLLIFLLM